MVYLILGIFAILLIFLAIYIIYQNKQTKPVREVLPNYQWSSVQHGKIPGTTRDGTKIRSQTNTTLGQCMRYTLENKLLGGFSYHPGNKECILSHTSSADVMVLPSEQPGWFTYVM